MKEFKFPDLTPPPVDYSYLEPPAIVNVNDVEGIEEFSEGGGITKYLITEYTAGVRCNNCGVFLAGPGQGSSWHTHTIETGQEDIFYIANGKGNYIYLQNGKVCTFEFKEGDAILSKHLTNYTWNTGTEDILIPYSSAPLGSISLLHEGDLIPL